MRMLLCLSMLHSRVDSARHSDSTMFERNLAGHAQFDFRSECDLAQNAKPCADALRPFAHPLETPVPIPLQRLRIDAAPIVAYGDAQPGGAIFDLSHDLLRPGMAVR